MKVFEYCRNWIYNRQMSKNECCLKSFDGRKYRTTQSDEAKMTARNLV